MQQSGCAGRSVLLMPLENTNRTSNAEASPRRGQAVSELCALSASDVRHMSFPCRSGTRKQSLLPGLRSLLWFLRAGCGAAVFLEQQDIGAGDLPA